MNAENQKIWQFLHYNPFVAKHLFFYDLNKNDFEGLFYGETSEYEAQEGVFIKTNWLYRIYSNFEPFYFKAIGFDNQEQVIAIENNGLYDELIILESFADLPYVFLQALCLHLNLINSQALFNSYPNIKSSLAIYEAWCESQNITLDEKGQYYDEYGHLIF